jgi:hypothetical protein
VLHYLSSSRTLIAVQSGTSNAELAGLFHRDRLEMNEDELLMQKRYSIDADRIEGRRIAKKKSWPSPCLTGFQQSSVLTGVLILSSFKIPRAARKVFQKSVRLETREAPAVPGHLWAMGLRSDIAPIKKARPRRDALFVVERAGDAGPLG